MDASRANGWIDVGSAVVATFSFAITLPIFNLLRENPEFFIARGFLPADYLVFAVGLAVGVPALLTGLVLAVPSTRVRSTVLDGIVGLLLGLLGMQILRNVPVVSSGSALIPLLASASLAIAATLAIRRWDGARAFWRICGVAPLLLIPYFLFSAPMLDARSTHGASQENLGIANPVPVVFLLFDELPLTSLLRSDGTINELRFPNFARLAEHTTWFKNAFANAPSTTQSVPSILTGRYPSDSHAMPVITNHPDNLFTLTRDKYSVVGGESVTMLCPVEECGGATPIRTRWRAIPTDTWYVMLHLTLPESMTAALPPIDEDWANFGADWGASSHPNEVDRNGTFDRFVSEIRLSEGPVLYFHHSLVPHRPWQYLPSGKTYEANPRVPGTDRSVWTDQEFLVDQGFQRHLSQVGMADRMVGQLIDQLEDQDLLDEALIVVTADHGIAFRPGQPMRGALEDGMGSVGAVPLFVSISEDMDGVEIETPVELVDVLPTIASTLQVEVDWAFDGIPLQATVTDGDTGRQVLSFPGPVAHEDSLSYRTEVTMDLARRYDLDGDWDHVLRADLVFDLIGRAPDELEVGPPLDWTVVLGSLDELDSVDLDSETLPVLIEGWVEARDEEGSEFTFALALNGSIAAVFETFNQARSDMISILIPEGRLRNGRNQVELYLIEDAGARLRPVIDVRSAG